MKIEDMTLRDYFAAKASEEDIKAQAEVIRSSSTLGILPDGWLAVARYMHADAMLAAREAGYALDDGCEPVEVEAALASRDAEIERLRHALELAVPVMDAHAGPSRLAEFVSAGRTAQAAREAFDEAAEMRRAEWHAEMRADAFGHPHE